MLRFMAYHPHSKIHKERTAKYGGQYQPACACACFWFFGFNFICSGNYHRVQRDQRKIDQKIFQIHHHIYYNKSPGVFAQSAKRR